jgi:N-acetylglucosamine malate deacetylase 1
MANKQLRIMMIGAHPDDVDFRAGGLSKLYTDTGHEVAIVSLTNGEKGYHRKLSIQELSQRRKAEAQGAGNHLGAVYTVLDFRDGELLPTLAVRNKIITLIREFRPDLVMTHRTNDYHPDHRYTSQSVQDALFMSTIPNTLPDIPAMDSMPSFFYFWDRFALPLPFKPTIVISIDSVIQFKYDALSCHVSQVYEAMPSSDGIPVPEDTEERRDWLRRRYEARFRNEADLYRTGLIELYGESIAGEIKYAEAFEQSEYGRMVTKDEMYGLFPFMFDSRKGKAEV